METFKLYKGSVVIDHDPNGISIPGSRSKPRYIVNGKIPFSVTQCTAIGDKSDVLVRWAIRLYKEYLQSNAGKLAGTSDLQVINEIIEMGALQHKIKKDSAAMIGTEAHDWAQAYFEGKKPKMPKNENVKNGVLAFLKWIDENKIKPIKNEFVIYSKKYDFVGRCDAAASVNKIKCIVDYKTSSGIYNEMRYQTAAYQFADEEESGQHYDGRWIIRFDKETAQFETLFMPPEEFKKDFNTFLAQLAIRKREAEIKQKLIK